MCENAVPFYQKLLKYNAFSIYSFYPTSCSTECRYIVLKISYSRSVVEDRRNTNELEDLYNIEPPRYYSERRRSSDIYLEPSTSDTSKRQTLLETDFDTDVITKVKPLKPDEPDKITSKN